MSDMDLYSEQDRKRPPLSQQKEFRSVKNAVIREAESIRLGRINFEDDGVERAAEERHGRGLSREVSDLRDTICNNELPLDERDSAVEELCRLAEDGSQYAQYAMGCLLLSGDPGIRDTQTGLRWLATAAERGNTYAAYRLGREYLRGKNTEKDVPAAVNYLTQAAEGGDPYAQYVLGKLYLSGRETPRTARRRRTG